MIAPLVPLGDLCDVLDSRRKPVTKRDRVAGEFPYYGATGILDYVSQYIFEEKLVLIGEDGAKWGAGEKTAFAAEGKYWVNNHAHVIRPDRNRVLDDWIIYYLNFSDLSKFITGLTVPKLNQGRLCEIPIPLPPLSEQGRIVAILDEAFAGLATATANAEKNLKNARDLFDSYLNSILATRGRGWEEKRLPGVAQVFGRGKSKHRPRNDPKLYGGPYPFVQTGDVSSADHWLTDYTQTYSALGLAQSRLWPKGTVCIAIVGATVGESAILQFEACFPDSVIGIVVDERIADAEYVEYLLQAFKALLKEKGKGTARDNINLGTFENQLFPFAPLKEQRLIVERLNEMVVLGGCGCLNRISASISGASAGVRPPRGKAAS